jgi:hypothetical protein
VRNLCKPVALTSLNPLFKNFGTVLVNFPSNKNNMKTTLLFIAAFLLVSFTNVAQSNYNLVIFSEDGDPFFAYVNGIRQNDKPETNVKVTNLNSEALNVRIEFESKSLPKLKQNMMPEMGYEHTVKIKRTMKKELKLQYFGRVPLSEAPKGNATEVAYHTSENPVNTSSSGSGEFNTGDGSVTTTTTSTQINTSPTNISINMGGTGVSINVNGTGNTQSSTGTTVTSSSSVSGQTTTTGTGTKGGGTKNPNPGAGATTQPVANTKTGCSVAMSEASYNKMKESVEDKPFSDTKMSTAKVATKNNCLSSAQIKGICELLSMDDDKLAYAKFAYDYCIDNYTVSEVFSFSKTTNELNKFLESK